jgi:hypothetical protein
MGLYLRPDDVTPLVDIELARLAVLIEDAETFATMAAPPLADPLTLTEQQRAQVKTILRRAVVRESDSGTGAKTQESAGVYSYTVDTRTARSVSFLTEEEQDALRGMVGLGRSTTAFTIDLTPLSTWDPITAFLTAEGV